MDSFFKNPTPIFLSDEIHEKIDYYAFLEYRKRIETIQIEFLNRMKKEDEPKFLEYISLTSRNKLARDLATDYKGDGTKPSPLFSWRGKLE